MDVGAPRSQRLVEMSVLSACQVESVPLEAIAPEEEDIMLDVYFDFVIDIFVALYIYDPPLHVHREHSFLDDHGR